MSNPFNIVKDSSIWINPDHFSAASKKDPYLRIGVVKAVYVDKITGDVRYHVEVQDQNDKIESTCRMLRRFGGVYNYEDIIHRGYKTQTSRETLDLSAKAGDVVLVAYMAGETRDGIILGGITHPARAVSLDIADGPQYKSEFNGVETSINKDGEYTVTFKGQPTNVTRLKDMPSKKILPPQYDLSVGSSFFKFDKTGSWEVSDNAQSLKQYLKIDKPGGKIALSAGNVTMAWDKNSENTSLKTKTLDVNATSKISETTQEYNLKASSSVKIKSPKVAIGTDGIELLEQIIKAIEKIGAVQPISPIGPCTSLMATPQWPDVDAIKAKISQIKGSL
jgi:hypothetical protein